MGRYIYDSKILFSSEILLQKQYDNRSVFIDIEGKIIERAGVVIIDREFIE